MYYLKYLQKYYRSGARYKFLNLSGPDSQYLYLHDLVQLDRDTSTTNHDAIKSGRASYRITILRTMFRGSVACIN